VGCRRFWCAAVPAGLRPSAWAASGFALQASLLTVPSSPTYRTARLQCQKGHRYVRQPWCLSDFVVNLNQQRSLPTATKISKQNMLNATLWPSIGNSSRPRRDSRHSSREVESTTNKCKLTPTILDCLEQAMPSIYSPFRSPHDLQLIFRRGSRSGEFAQDAAVNRAL